MDVTLPNGQVIKNVPDGFSKADLVAKLKANGHDVSWYKEEPPASVPPANFGADTLEQPTIMGKAGKIINSMLPQSVKEGISGGASSYRSMFGEKAFPKYGDENSTATTVGKILDPVPLAAGGVAGAGVNLIPRVARAGGLVRSLATGAGAGGAASVPQAVGDLEEGDFKGALVDTGKGIGTGAVLGPALSAVGRGANAAYGGIRNIASGAEGQAINYLRELFANRQPQALAAVRALRGNVPGEMPTVGRAAVGTNLPEFKAMEEGARRRSQSHLFEARDTANDAARLRPLQEMAEPGAPGIATQGGQPGLSEAEALRKRVTDPLYELADADRIQLNPQLAQIMQGPEIQAALGRAGRTFGQQQTNAVVAGRPVPTGQTPGVQQGGNYRVIRNPDTGAEVATVHNTPFMPDHGATSIADLQLAKNEISKQLKDLASATDSAGITRRAQLEEARRQLTQQMTGQSGNYAVANTMFRNLSAPQNQAEVAQVLANALRSPSGADRPAAYLRALHEAPQTIKRAGGDPRFQQIEQIMTPDQMQAIRGIRNSAQQETAYSNIKAPGTEVVRPRSTLDRIEEALPAMLNKPMTFARSVLRRQGAQSESQIQQMVDRAMADPAAMERLLAGVPPAERNATINAIRSMAQDSGNFGAGVGSISSNINKE